MKRHSIQPYSTVALDLDFSKEWKETAGDSAFMTETRAICEPAESSIRNARWCITQVPHNNGSNKMNKQNLVLERYSTYEQSHQREKKIMVLSQAAGLAERLIEKLEQFRLTAESVDYTKPLLSQISKADVLVNGLGKVDKTLIDSCPRLKLIRQVGTGIDNVDLKYCTLKSIHVANVPQVNNVAVAEHTLFLMIYMAKNMKSAGEGLMKGRVLMYWAQSYMVSSLLLSDLVLQE